MLLTLQEDDRQNVLMCLTLHLNYVHLSILLKDEMALFSALNNKNK